MNVFIKLTSSTNIVHDIIFFDDDDQRDKWELLSSLEENFNSMFNVLFMLDVKLLFFSQSERISLKRNIFQAKIEINTHYFIIFKNNHILYAFNEHMNISKINVFINMFNNRRDNDDLTVILKIKKFYINCISLIVMMYNLQCKRCEKSKFKINDFNRLNKNLKNILLLFNEFNILIINIVKHDKQRSWDMLIKSKWIIKIIEVTCFIKNFIKLFYVE